MRTYENQTNGHSGKKNSKFSEKKRIKEIYREKNAVNGGNVELSDIVVDNQDAEEKAKKKSRLKRRKRVRQADVCDSELSDSDITLNDSSSENEFPSGMSESDEEVVSSGSEDLDETLLIIDQKIKEKKVKEEGKIQEVNGVAKTEEQNGEKKQLMSVSEFEKNISKNGIVEQNGAKLANEKDKSKSLFTILNGVEEVNKLNENSKGDYVSRKGIGSETANGIVPEPAALKNSDQG